MVRDLLSRSDFAIVACLLFSSTVTSGRNVRAIALITAVLVRSAFPSSRPLAGLFTKHENLVDDRGAERAIHVAIVVETVASRIDGAPQPP